ncbi:MAG TPA: hypothetical protein VMR96_05745, partial [Solirubrobacterales bacterium]|nr:hypothetical protein [Solirubrobacterales bacterium]
MERSSDHNDLATALAEARPVPRDAFARELDERVAAGFPRRSRLDGSPLAGLAAWVRALSPQRLLFAGGSAALAAIAIATVVVASSGPGPSEPRSTNGLLSDIAPVEPGDSSGSEIAPQASTYSPASKAAGKSAASGESASATTRPFRSVSPPNLSSRHREIERS